MHNPPTILEAATQLGAGRLAPIDLVEECLDRIDRYESRIRAWVMVDREGAREAAHRLASSKTAGKRDPLWGIPVGIKDIIDVRGWPTRAGSPLRHDHCATDDAGIVARLRSQGAILLGKTVTTEFASFDPSPTRNPWDLSRTPGGSSSGSAAAVALGMCLGALGSQTGGSITRPASYCGVAGAKPTLGRVSTTGLVPFSFHLDHPGPLARTVSDLAALLDSIAGYDANDPVSVDASMDSCLAACASSTPPRFGLIESFFMEKSTPAVSTAIEEAIRLLRQGGATVKSVALPSSFSRVHESHRRIMAVEAAEYHRAAFTSNRPGYGPEISKLLDEGLSSSAVDYAESLAHQKRFQREMQAVFDGVDCLLTPATDGEPPGLETTGNPRFNSPWSYSGQPTISFPCAVSAGGLPIAIQLIGRAFDEPGLFRAAAWCERQVRFDRVPPLLKEDGIRRTSADQ